MLELLVPAVITPLVTGLVAYIARRRSAKQRQQNADEVARITDVNEEDQKTGASPSAELLSSIKKQIGARVATSPHLSLQEFDDEIEEHFREVQERLEKIEASFPAEDELAKVAARKDEVLSSRIDELSRQVRNLEKNTLSKWDVALTVSTIIAALAAVVGGTYGVLNALGRLQ